MRHHIISFILAAIFIFLLAVPVYADVKIVPAGTTVAAKAIGLIKDIYISPAEPVINNPAALAVETKNYGNIAGVYNLSFTVSKAGPIFFNHSCYFALAKFEEQNCSASWTPNETGIYQLYAELWNETFSLSDTKSKQFTVVGVGAYDILVEVLKKQVYASEYVRVDITLRNKGTVTQDVSVNYSIVGFGVSSFTAALGPGANLTQPISIQAPASLGTYTVRATAYWDNQTASATDSFEVISPVVAAAPALVGAVITGFLPVVPQAELKASFPDQITVPQGEEKTFGLFITNSGNLTLHDIKPYVYGIESKWISIGPEICFELEQGKVFLFLISISVSKDATPADYPFQILVQANESYATLNPTLRVISPVVLPVPPKFEIIKVTTPLPLKPGVLMLNQPNIVLFDIKNLVNELTNITVFLETPEWIVKPNRIIKEVPALGIESFRFEITPTQEGLHKITVYMNEFYEEVDFNVEKPVEVPWLLIAVIIILIVVAILIIKRLRTYYYYGTRLREIKEIIGGKK